MKEVWKAIPGYRDYEASSLGRIRSKTRTVEHIASLHQSAYTRVMKGKILKPWLSTVFQYESVSLSIKGKSVNRSVHILVCLAFNGLPPSKDKANALHNDGDKYNNTPDNLYWGSLVENSQDMIRHGNDRYGEKHPNVKLTLKAAQSIYDGRMLGVSAKSLATQYGVSVSNVCDIYKARTWPQVNRNNRRKRKQPRQRFSFKLAKQERKLLTTR